MKKRVKPSHQGLQKSEYAINNELIKSEILLRNFVQLSEESDEQTKEFIQQCNRSYLSATQMIKDSTASFLKLAFSFSQTDANGLVGRGEMFVLSPDQLEKLSPNFAALRETTGMNNKTELTGV